MTNPEVRLRVGHQHPQFWPILASFVDCYSLFWGLGVISTIDEPRGAFTCWSSTLAVLADSGLFHGLLLTILPRFGVPERFSRLTIPRVRLPVGHQHSQFWPILARFMDYYSLFWCLGVISTIDEPQGTLTCRSSTLIVLADSGPFCGLLLTVLGSQSESHD